MNMLIVIPRKHLPTVSAIVLIIPCHKMTALRANRAVTEFLARLEQGERFVTVKSWQLKGSGEQTQRGELLLEVLLEAYELKQSAGG